MLSIRNFHRRDCRKQTVRPKGDAAAAKRAMREHLSTSKASLETRRR